MLPCLHHRHLLLLLLLRTQRCAQIISDFHGCSRLSFKEVIVEMKMLYTIAFPMIITGLLIYGKSFISMLFLGKDALAGGSLAIAIANISGYSILYGLALGMEPISSQAFGAKQWPLLSQTLHRTLLLLLLSLACIIPISILWLNIHPFLLFFNLDSSISAAAAPPTSPSPSPLSSSNPSSTPSRSTSELRTSFPPSCLAPPSPSPSMSPLPTSSLPTFASVSLAWPWLLQLPTWPS